MESKTSMSLLATALFAVLALTICVSAQNPTTPSKQHIRYRFVDLGTFGGPASYVNGAPALGAPNQINRQGTTVGAAATTISIPPNSNLAICGGIDGVAPFVFHAFTWRQGSLGDLGALPGADTCSVATSINARGEIVGHSENTIVDPITGVREIRAVLWKDGKMRNLGTFGGRYSVVGNINDRGQVAGAALNAVLDPFSLLYLLFGSSNGTQTRAFLWEDGYKRDLGTLGGPDAAASFVNRLGEVMGVSYTGSTPNQTTGIPTQDPFLWRKGKMIDLGTLGGTVGGPVALNNRSQVIGVSNLAGDQSFDPFLWENGKMVDLFTESKGGSPISANALNDTGEIVGGGAFPGRPFDAYIWRNGVATDLGALDGDCYSEAFLIDSRSRIVGQSFPCDFSTVRAFLWQDGTMFDLQQLVPAQSGFRLVETLAINDLGQIGGIGKPSDCTTHIPECGHAYVLIPCGDDDDNVDCEEQVGSTDTATRSNTSSVKQSIFSQMDAIARPRDIAARIHSQFGRPGRVGIWPQRQLMPRPPQPE
jgi:probable HAF family extracellular repeat protein